MMSALFTSIPAIHTSDMPIDLIRFCNLRRINIDNSIYSIDTNSNLKLNKWLFDIGIDIERESFVAFIKGNENNE